MLQLITLLDDEPNKLSICLESGHKNRDEVRTIANDYKGIGPVSEPECSKKWDMPTSATAPVFGPQTYLHFRYCGSSLMMSSEFQTSILRELRLKIGKLQKYLDFP